MDTIPQQVTEAVRAVADATRPYPGDLADVRRRARRRKRRQTGFAAAAAMAVLAVAGVVVTGGPGSGPDVLPAASADAAAEVRLQRLFLDGAARPARLTGESGMAEIIGSGTLTIHDVTGTERWDRVVGLPDGTMVAAGGFGDRAVLGRAAPLPADQVEYRLVVTEPDGRPRLERDVRRAGETVSLLTATASTAYLWRPSGLVAHDLATGSERPVVSAKALGLAKVPAGAADLTGDRLALARGGDGCVVRILDGPAATPAAELPVTGDCERITRIRLSPDGRMVAVVHQGATAIPGVTVFRIGDGAVLARSAAVVLDPATGALAGRPAAEEQLVAIAWWGERWVRGVSYRTDAATGEEAASKPFADFDLRW
ncbi:hypothetical protein [Actinoplanes sp. G11-F43]|uniref:hypothetical protein n=1 Tax=Actinoplanes sp. G11-F43 TaxID=3424130 RepID=UPI003D327018